MQQDYLLEAHREWIGYVQPVGLLVAPAALIHRGIIPDSNVAALQEQLDEITATGEDGDRSIPSVPDFVTTFLGWRRSDLAGAAEGPELPEDLCAELIEYQELLVPTYAVPTNTSGGGWQMLIRVEPNGVDLDTAIDDDGRHWAASPQVRFERLLRETNVPVGLITNLQSLRLVYAPKGETSGFATFDLKSMLEVAGRPMLSALHMLLRSERLFGAAEQTLPSLLAESRDYQETVSTKLSQQVVVALNELLGGFYAADMRMRRRVILDLAATEPEHLYSGLLTALMRLVFILYAEDRDLFPRDALWEQNYSLGGLFERLRGDAALYPDTMDDRYGAWAQILALWRLMYFGGRHADLNLIARRGQLFDPERFRFLEGRTTQNSGINLPAVSDGVVWRVLQALMLLEGERLSYRTLDVEQIGSVYQSVMGFTIDVTTGKSIAIRSQKRSGASATIDLESLLRSSQASRADWVRQQTDRKLAPKAATALREAQSISQLQEALSGIIDEQLTAEPLPAGVPVLQPTEARRRTGSHYTPRQLTAPIVAEALRPRFERLGAAATADEVLALRVLDPALGSGAFLVEACRQIADRLVLAWEHHRNAPQLPPDEDAVLHARRLVAQQCLYGIDRNPMAADLAKLSLWLATLARDHEFTFLDHAIRHGDALVGLSLNQIEGLSWGSCVELPLVSTIVSERLAKAAAERQNIRASSDDTSEVKLKTFLIRAEDHLRDVNLIGDALIRAFFEGSTARSRESNRRKVAEAFGFGESGWGERLRELNATFSNATSVRPFHWELQFPEVFLREDPGFDVIIGNPPYAGKNTLASSNPEHYIEWLQTIHPGTHGNADLVAHFLRRAFVLLRRGGTFGLIATKTISQGDTRAVGLRWIRDNGGTIYDAKRRFKWPGEAAVVVCVVHVAKGDYAGPYTLDNRSVPIITAFLLDHGPDHDPFRLASNANICFQGSIIHGPGFLFDDNDKTGRASPIAVMRELTADPRNDEVIFPYIGGEDVASDPELTYRRYVIDFGVMTESEAATWPDVFAIVRQKVRPERLKDKDKRARDFWWQHLRPRQELYTTIRSMERVLVTGHYAKHLWFTFLPSNCVFTNKLNIIPRNDFSSFCVLQSRVHEIWARTFSSTLVERLAYTPTDCLETFPFPEPASSHALAEIGSRYYKHRTAIMAERAQGLTDIYNLFNDPNNEDADIKRLRELHDEMDQSVIAAYGWTDMRIDMVFEPEWLEESGDGPMRYRWSEDAREDLLGRLLDLNAAQSSSGGGSPYECTVAGNDSGIEAELEEA